MTGGDVSNRVGPPPPLKRRKITAATTMTPRTMASVRSRGFMFRRRAGRRDVLTGSVMGTPLPMAKAMQRPQE